MWKSTVNRREQMVSDGYNLLTLDLDHWKSINPDVEPIQLPIDFTLDVEIRKASHDIDDEDVGRGFFSTARERPSLRPRRCFAVNVLARPLPPAACGVSSGVLDFYRRDAHHLLGVADHGGGALFAFRTCRPRAASPIDQGGLQSQR